MESVCMVMGDQEHSVLWWSDFIQGDKPGSQQCTGLNQMLTEKTKPN